MPNVYLNQNRDSTFDAVKDCLSDRPAAGPECDATDRWVATLRVLLLGAYPEPAPEISPAIIQHIVGFHPKWDSQPMDHWLVELQECLDAHAGMDVT